MYYRKFWYISITVSYKFFPGRLCISSTCAELNGVKIPMIYFYHFQMIDDNYANQSSTKYIIIVYIFQEEIQDNIFLWMYVEEKQRI